MCCRTSFILKSLILSKQNKKPTRRVGKFYNVKKHRGTLFSTTFRPPPPPSSADVFYTINIFVYNLPVLFYLSLPLFTYRTRRKNLYSPF